MGTMKPGQWRVVSMSPEGVHSTTLVESGSRARTEAINARGRGDTNVRIEFHRNEDEIVAIDAFAATLRDALHLGLDPVPHLTAQNVADILIVDRASLTDALAPLVEARIVEVNGAGNADETWNSARVFDGRREAAIENAGGRGFALDAPITRA